MYLYATTTERTSDARAQRSPSELLARLAEYDPAPGDYVRHNIQRLASTLELIPQGSGEVLELGSDRHFTLLLSQLTNYRVRPQNLREPLAGAGEDTGDSLVRFRHASTGQTIEFERTLFNAELDRFPYADGHFAGVVCCELLEHLLYDPVWMLSEINRVLSPGGWLVLTTPNLLSWGAISLAIQGIHPMEHSKYFRSRHPVQHTREYAPFEVAELLTATGFSIDHMATRNFFPRDPLGLLEYPLVAFCWLYNALRLRHPKHMMLRFRRPHLVVVARKATTPSDRYPSFLYTDS